MTARHKPKFYSVFYGIYPTFIITKSVCRQDGGDCECSEVLKIVFLLISIPSVTARNSFRIVKTGLSEYCTASQKIISAVPPPLFRGEAREDCDLCYFLHNLDTFCYVIFFHCHFGRVVKPLPCTITLASLVKGEVLSPEKIRATTGGIATPPLAPHQPFQNRTILLAFRTAIVCVLIRFRIRTIPRKALSPLPPLEKGEVACRQAKDLKIRLYYAIYQTPAYLQLFCLQDGGD
mgnify:CR=1 FL=1